VLCLGLFCLSCCVWVCLVVFVIIFFVVFPVVVVFIRAVARLKIMTRVKSTKKI